MANVTELSSSRLVAYTVHRYYRRMLSQEFNATSVLGKTRNRGWRIISVLIF
jgi:hypothetical protein